MSSFKYTSLKNGEIRIVELHPGRGADRIQGSLKVVSAESQTPERYSALSYTWGSESQLRSTIVLDGQQFEVRQNLFEALQQLRYQNRSRHLWVDAICINQEDNEDKKMQIPLMSLIYSKAETVEIWLGTDEGNGELGLRSVASGELEAIATPEIVCAVIDLLQRPWFSRVWIIQELVLAGRDGAFVNCGRARVSWDLFSLGMVDELMKSFDKTADEVFFAATLLILRNDTFPNMYHEYPTIPPSMAKRSSVPSWTIDFSFTGTTFAELRFTSFTKFAAPRQENDKLVFSSDGKEMTVDVCIVDTITDVLDHATVARAPDTPEAWDAYSLRFCKAAGIEAKTPMVVGWQDRLNVEDFVREVNMITFLEEAHKLYRQRPAYASVRDTTTSFWVAVLSGLHPDRGKDTSRAVPTGSQLAEQGDILLGRHDTAAAAAAPTVLRLAHLIALALELPDPQAASLAPGRRFLAPLLYSGLQQVLAPRGCDVLSGFYATDNGLYGLCLPGAQVGDVIARLFRGAAFEIPIVLRPEAPKRYSVVCVASVSDGWEEVCRARGAVDPEEVVLV